MIPTPPPHSLSSTTLEIGISACSPGDAGLFSIDGSFGEIKKAVGGDEPDLNRLDLIEFRSSPAGWGNGKNFDRSEAFVIESPLRICPLGAHVDHQGGVVTGMTVDREVLLVAGPASDAVARS